MTKFISLLRIQTIKKKGKDCYQIFKKKRGKEREKNACFLIMFCFFERALGIGCLYVWLGNMFMLEIKNAWFVYIIHDDWSSCTMVTGLGRENVNVKTQITDGLLIL